MVRVFLRRFSVLLRLSVSLFLCVLCVRECVPTPNALEPVELLIQVGNNYNVYILRVTFP